MGFARYDGSDNERTHLDLREAYWAYEAENWDLTVRINKVFWGVTESRHMVGVINQTDLIEDIDGEDKLGQPMVNLNLQRGWGRVGFFVLPYLRERTFPGQEGRLRATLPVDSDHPLYESSAEETHVDLSVRYSHYFGELDVGAHLFTGTNREPRFVLNAAGDALLPVYEQIDQVGVDLQYTRDAWLWKTEAIARRGATDDFAALVGGFEYTFFQLNEQAHDLGIVVELLYDGRAETEPATLIDNDIFVGVRWALNDIQDTSLLAGVAVDTSTQEMFFNLEAERRLGDSLVGELRLRTFTNAVPQDALFPFSRDDYAQVQLKWHF